MDFDVPRVFDRAPLLPAEKARSTRRTKLLALAGALDDIGLRARIVEYTLRPSLLRCWDPAQMGLTLTVTCERSQGDEPRWQFRHHPGGEVFADAEDVAEPDDAHEAARRLAEILAR
ncbi:hypothetical protein ACIBF1_15305 [Spirillospora sp. NPDC050679]